MAEQIYLVSEDIRRISKELQNITKAQNRLAAAQEERNHIWLMTLMMDCTSKQNVSLARLDELVCEYEQAKAKEYEEDYE